ncbi:aminotransferase class III-fold pyridoxal phosphate-dependent enzyme [Lacrimispora sp. NSJ-141]|uniref:Aminotransferase class III-fold pyridoxal phosphate-dependent enzyme n=1 Tax=Lientehia hominis TaxID=2897778 RepID=A0AAP2RL67_9FIRM|nr:aminotransferase class III-fold pyridoxal phosphate-dependent enzyme [Lientehia hominis]MCD2493035.1 aminotransferase class III-fold pyridoxal phosphate-dependent enzyme [Lientehia hominis]
MINDCAKSKELSKRFNEIYPAGHSNNKDPYEVADYRLFIKKAKGSHVWDIDGNEYIEFNSAFGPTLLGHCNDEYIRALEDALETSATLSGSNLLFSEDDVEVGEVITKYVPCAEQIKFNMTGSEAVQMAIRIARAYTGKNMILRFTDNYHGWIDNIYGGRPGDLKSEKMPVAEEDPDSDYQTLGKFPGAIRENIILPWNDFDVFKKTMEKYHDEIAIVHFEPIVCNHFGFFPKPGFLELIRELCTKYNVVMSMDEIITGFRLGFGGAQTYFGVTPDICTLAKSIAGGLPMACVAGRKKVMSILDGRKVAASGTFNGWNLGMRAVLATTKILERDGGAAYKKMYALEDKLIEGILTSAGRHGIKMRINDCPGAFFTLFGVEGGRQRVYTPEDMKEIDIPLFKKFRRILQEEEGVITLPAARWYMNISHTEADIDYTIAAVDRAMGKL